MVQQAFAAHAAVIAEDDQTGASVSLVPDTFYFELTIN